jgi:hypothetical protein
MQLSIFYDKSLENEIATRLYVSRLIFIHPLRNEKFNKRGDCSFSGATVMRAIGSCRIYPE